jgi:hypoxanthine phosphoribosyltransferase
VSRKIFFSGTHTNMVENLKKLFNENEIQAAVKRLAEAISRDFDDEELVLVSVLKGSFMFISDLMREIKNPVVVDFIRASSYGCDTVTSGKVTLTKDLETDIAGKNVIIVEDIIDSGLTLTAIREMLLARKPRSLKICALIDKRARRKVIIEGDYVGFSIEDGFIVGYGIDYAERYRNLPVIYVVEQGDNEVLPGQG